MISLGTVPAGSTVYIPFATYAAATGASATCTGLAVTDIEIYKNGSTTQRASDAGYALLDTDGIDFDGITGLHGFSIDLNDNTDAGFFAVGSWYWVVVSSITVDSQTVTFLAAVFRIGPAENTAGYPVVDTGKIGGTTQTARDIGASVLLSSGTGTGQVTLTSGRVNADMTHIATAAVSTSTAQLGVNLVNIAGSAVSTSTAQLGVNVVNAAGTAWGSGAITAGSIATGAITNAKFAAGAIDAAAIANNAIDAATFAADVDAEAAAWIWNAATASYGTAGTYGALLESGNVGGGAIVAASVTGAVGSVTTVSDKTGYSLTATTGLGNQTANITGTVSGNSTHSAADVKTAIEAAGSHLTLILEDTGTTLPATLSTIAGYIDTEVAAILADTDELQKDWTNDGRLDLLIDAIKAKTDLMLDAAAIRTAVGLATANLDTQLADIPTVAEFEARTIVSANYATAASITTIDTLLDKFAPLLIGTVSGAGTASEVFVYGGVTATVVADVDGNRTSVTFS